MIKSGMAHEKFPMMDKATFMQQFEQVNTRGILRTDAMEVATQAENSRNFSPMINGITVGLSSGTSGNRGIFLASEKERARWVAAILDRVVGFRFRKRSVAFFLRANSNLYGSVQSSLLSFQFFDLLDPCEQHVKRLQQLQPSILVAQPSMLLELATAVEKGILRMKPEKIISVAEVLYPEDRKRLENSFGQSIHQVYQCTEGFLATTCREGNLHFNEDFLIIEKKMLQEGDNRFHPVITDLLRETQPVIRYELNDIIHPMENCPCGSPYQAIQQIEGRSDDVLIFTNDLGNDVRIYPDFFRRAIILAHESIQEYTLVQRNKTQLDLFVDEEDEIFQLTKASIELLLQQHRISNVMISKAKRSDFERGTKLRRIRHEST
jgi:putative adenylate-forming enzyme